MLGAQETPNKVLGVEVEAYIRASFLYGHFACHEVRNDRLADVSECFRSHPNNRTLVMRVSSSKAMTQYW